MTLPGIVMGVAISTFLGAAFHLWKGGNIIRFFYYLILSWSGFWLGHTLGNLWNWTFLSLGPIRLGMAVMGVILFLGVGYWLSLFNQTAKS
jgi:hypothetical protein